MKPEIEDFVGTHPQIFHPPSPESPGLAKITSFLFGLALGSVATILSTSVAVEQSEASLKVHALTEENQKITAAAEQIGQAFLRQRAAAEAMLARIQELEAKIQREQDSHKI